jgi:nucleoside-diphosphate-sugar epimerase
MSFMPKRVVVFGGLGFIGQALTMLLVDAGDAVTVVSRNLGTAKDGSQVRYCQGDVTDAERVSEIIQGADVVYDLSLARPNGTSWEDWERCTVGGARNVARACLQHRVSRLIYTSSTAALYLGGRGKLDETGGCDPQPKKRNFYARAKIEAERALLALRDSDKLPAVIFRPAIVLGPRGRLVHAALGNIVSEIHIHGFCSGIYPLPCVLVGDVAQALFLAKDLAGIDGMTFNLAGDVRPTTAEYVGELRRRSMRNFQFYPRPVWTIVARDRLLWALKALVRKSGNECPSVHETYFATLSLQLDCSKAKTVLGWKPTSDREEFFQQAINSHLRSIRPGDLRLAG